MPPKKKGKGAQAPNKKTEEKKKEKIIEDKTFGLKNKKGAAQQKFIKGVKSQVHGAQKGGEQYQLNQEYKAREEKKKAKADNALLASLFKSVSTIKVDPNADPKTIPCQYFKQGMCQKGARCKFSHDVEAPARAAKPDLYTDSREHVRTEIICRYFLEAVTKKTFGWGWKCPNQGDACTYKHALPQGYVLNEDDDEFDLGEEEEEIPIEEQIEEERAKLPAGGTPVTFETFMAWKERKQAEAEAKMEEERKKAARKTGGRGLQALTGKALFKFDPTMFVDDDSAMQEYDEEPDNEEEEEKAGGSSEEVKEEEEPPENQSNEETEQNPEPRAPPQAPPIEPEANDTTAETAPPQDPEIDTTESDQPPE